MDPNPQKAPAPGAGTPLAASLLLALLCGSLTGLALPRSSLCLLAWFSLSPLFYLWRRCRTWRRAALIGLAAGFGYHGTVEFDWYTNEVKVFMHHSPRNETITFDSAALSHGGGDRELVYDFLQIVQGKGVSRSPIEAGIISALTCLKARESAETRQFCEVKMD